MRLEFEIVRLVNGHLFDAESYEVTTLKLALSHRRTGYYVVRWPHERQPRRDDPAPGFWGPFRSAEDATSAVRDLQLLRGALESGSTGSEAFFGGDEARS